MIGIVQETREILLTQGKVAIVDAEDYERLKRWRWSYAAIPGASGYARRGESPYPGSCKTRTVLMHRQILNVAAGQSVDHINGNGLDNRKINLRTCTHQQNCHNRQAPPRALVGYIGVTRHRDKFQGRIMIGRQAICLGSRYTPEEAARDYDAAAKYLRGPFARLNFPLIEIQARSPLLIRAANMGGSVRGDPERLDIKPFSETI